MKAKFRLKVVNKLMLGFGLVIAAVIFSSIFVYNMMRHGKEETEHIKKVNIPSVEKLSLLSDQITESKSLIKLWVENKEADSPEKQKLKLILNKSYPALKDEIAELAVRWDKTQQETAEEIISGSNAYFSQLQAITNDLDTITKYDNKYLVTRYKSDVAAGNVLMELAENITHQITNIISLQREEVLRANNRIDKAFGKYNVRVTYYGIISVLLIFIVGFLLARSIIFPINYVKSILFSMSSGELPSKPVKTSTDEIGQMGAALNNLVAGLRQKADFATGIGQNDFNASFKPLGPKDTLGNSLVEMRESLVRAAEEAEARRIENQERSWSAQGLANFNELIRNHSKTLDDFTTNVISELTEYLEAQLGGFYVVNSDKKDAYLSLNSFYAYSRHKFIKRDINLGENLVGQAVLEQDTIFITDIPDDYVDVSSGLGKEKPNSLLIVPLKLNDRVFGVIELASFKIFKRFEIEFVEKVGEIFASTLSNIHIQEQTAKLLADSNEKSEILARQEKQTQEKIQELQNALEKEIENNKEQIIKYQKLEQEYKNEIKSFNRKLRLTTDELKNVSLTLDNNVAVINNTMGILEVSMSGEISKANNKYLQMTGMTLIDLTGKSIDSFMSSEIVKSEEYLSLWQQLKDGGTATRVNTCYFKGVEKHFLETYTPVKNHKNEYYKIVISSVDLQIVENIKKS